MKNWSLTLHYAGEVIKEFLLPEGAFLIGTDASCGVVVEVEGVSPVHAEIQLGEEGLQVEDFGSTTGTLVNGYAISGRVAVEFPASVQVGDAVLVLEEVAAGAPNAQQEGNELSQDTEPNQPEDTLLRGEMGNASVHMQYALRREIARGGMGKIYEGTDSLLVRQVAVKISSVSFGGEDLRFNKEAKILAHLAHPNIVPIYAIGMDELERPFYSMKLVKGRTLQAVLDALAENDEETKKTYTRDRLLTVFHKILDAMAFAHSKHILHRDLKPENIMVAEYGEVLVMDWGLAKPLGEKESLPASTSAHTATSDMGLTIEGEVIGTPQYMSPEQAEGINAELDFRSDIYSLGGILYAILTLRPPVEGTDLDEVLTKVKKGELTAMATRRSTTNEAAALKAPSVMEKSIPEALKAVTLKAMARDREGRYQSVEDLISDLEAYQHGFATNAEKAGRMRKILLAIKRNKTASIAALLIVGLTAGFMGKVIASEKKAQLSIERLRETAPTFASNAKALVENAVNDPNVLEEALKNIAYAIELDPRTMEYRLIHGKILQTLQRLDDARKVFAQVLAEESDNADAKTNLLLCDRFLQEQKNGERLSNQSLSKLAAALRDQDRQAEALFLNRDSNSAAAGNIAALQAAIRKAGIFQGPPPMVTGEGELKLVLISEKMDDLRFLRGIPLNELEIHNARNLNDLSPLSSLPLKSLLLDHQTSIPDLSSLNVPTLKKLIISFKVKNLAGLEKFALEEFTQYSVGPNPVMTQDFTPLSGRPLKKVELGRGAQIPDLAIFSGMPLKTLRLNECSVGNLEALTDTALETLEIRTLVQPILQNLQFLKGNKTLAVLHAGGNKLIKDISALEGLPLKDLRLADTMVSDLSPLSGAPLEVLDLRFTPVSSLAQLKNLSNLVSLSLDGTPITDLTPLVGTKLQSLMLAHCERLASLAPLAQIPTLRTLSLPIRARNMEPLRALKNLGSITYQGRYKESDRLIGKSESARDFWKMVDLEKQVRQSDPSGKLRPSKFPFMPERFPGATAYNGHWYFFMSGQFSWLQAKAIAEELGGHLATITSIDEYNATRNFVKGHIREGQACWLGAQAERPKTPFRWVSGEPWAFTHWGRPTEPAQLDDFGNPATVLAFADFQRLPGTPNLCALAPENAAVSGFLVEWED